MRRIISREAEEKKRRKNQLIIGMILIVVMVFSVLGYSLSSFGNNNSSGTIINYNGFKFTQSSNFWNANVGSYSFSFKYNPTQTEKINSVLNSLESYNGKPLYISSADSEAEIEIYKNLFSQNQIVQRIQEACLDGQTCAGDLPIKNCDNNFIIIKEGDNNSITQEKNCVFIEGNKGNLTELSDSFLFKINGIQ